jgi:hypothetical protein
VRGKGLESSQSTIESAFVLIKLNHPTYSTKLQDTNLAVKKMGLAIHNQEGGSFAEWGKNLPYPSRLRVSVASRTDVPTLPKRVEEGFSFGCLYNYRLLTNCSSI